MTMKTERESLKQSRSELVKFGKFSHHFGVMRQFALYLILTLCSGFAIAEKPNILLIMADDIGIEGLSCYGGTSYETPRLDALAAGGIRFTHTYSQPLCTPTRVQIMTGKYNHRNWLYFGILDPEEKTFGHLMSDAGYKTCIAGKWQLQSYDPPDFSGAEKRRGLGMKVADAGFDEYQLFHSWHTEDKGSRYANPTFDRNGELVEQVEGKYGPDTSVDFILDFYRRNRDKPTFVYYPMALPHWPVMPTPDSAVWADPSRRLEEDIQYFPDMVAYMDKAVGQLVDGLEALDLRKKTIVIFYSDNGTDQQVTSGFKGEEIQGGKATPLQTGIRVPLIVNRPGTIAPQQICSDLIDASDFLPTLAALGDTNIPEDWFCDGISFAPQILGKSGPKRESAFFWYDPRPGWDKDKFSRHIFALDHDYKLFSDGRFFKISGEGFQETPLSGDLSSEAVAARKKLAGVIEQKMKPPISASAKKLVDAFGNEITE